MSIELKCKCGVKTSPTNDWKEIPDTCSVCKDQVQVRGVTKAEEKDSWKK